MKRLFFITILIFCFCFAAIAQDTDEHMPIDDPNIYGKISWDEEKKKLTGLASVLNKDTDLVGLIGMYIDNKTPQNQLKERIENIINHLTKNLKIEKTRFHLVLLSFDSEQTRYFEVSKSKVEDSMDRTIISNDDRFKQISDYFNEDKN